MPSSQPGTPLPQRPETVVVYDRRCASPLDPESQSGGPTVIRRAQANVPSSNSQGSITQSLLTNWRYVLATNIDRIVRRLSKPSTDSQQLPLLVTSDSKLYRRHDQDVGKYDKAGHCCSLCLDGTVEGRDSLQSRCHAFDLHDRVGLSAVVCRRPHPTERPTSEKLLAELFTKT